MRESRDLDRVLSAIQAGDRPAWEALVRGQTRRLFGVAWAITRDAGLAEDVVQETFLRLAQGRLRWLRRGAAEAFLSSAVSRRAIDALRRRRTRERREARCAMDRESVERPPEERLLSAELRRELEDGLLLLDPETRAAVWLHLAEGKGRFALEHVPAGTRRLVVLVSDEQAWGEGYALAGPGAVEVVEGGVHEVEVRTK